MCRKKQVDGSGKLHRTFTFPILMGEPCHTGVSLSRYTGHGCNLSNSCLRNITRIAHFISKGHGVQFPLARCIRSFIDGLPIALQEAARIDGANDFIIFAKIVLPLCKPVLATVALFVAVGQWNSFMDTYLYARDLPTLQYVLYEIMEKATIKVDPHAAEQLKSAVSPMSIRMAITIIATVPILIVYPFLQRYFVGGMTIGAVKD